MLKRILTAVLMLFVLLVVNSAGASNTVLYSLYSGFLLIILSVSRRTAGRLFWRSSIDAIAEHTGWTMNIKAVRGNSVWR